MNLPNHFRMFQLIDQVFATRQDPDQLQVSESQMKKLQVIHRNTLSEFANEEGPLIWALIFPTLSELMLLFLKGEITENQLLDQTPIPSELSETGKNYDCIYLCSVTTLPELRGKGETKKICLQAIQAIQKDYPIRTLFVWAFTKEGNNLAQRLSKDTGLELQIKNSSSEPPINQNL